MAANKQKAYKLECNYNDVVMYIWGINSKHMNTSK